MFDEPCLEFTADRGQLLNLAGRSVKTTVLHRDVSDNLELSDVATHLNASFLNGGAAMLSNLIENPISTPQSRQDSMRVLHALYTQHRGYVDEQFAIMKRNEDTTMWFMQQRSQEEDTLIDTVFFKNLVSKHFNNHAPVLAAYNLYKMVVGPAMSIVSPLVYIIVPFVILRLKYKVDIGFGAFCKLVYKIVTSRKTTNNGTLVSLLFSLFVYGQNVFSAVEVSKLTTRLNRDLWRAHGSVHEYHVASVNVHRIFKAVDVSGFVDAAGTPTPLASSVPDVFRVGLGIGSTLKEYHSIDKANVRSGVLLSYVYDALTSVFRKGVTTFVTFVHGAKYPEVSCKGLMHVCLPNSVPNDVEFGGERPNNAIITGPNAGGKSTLVKAIFVNMVVAQALGVTTCTEMRMTPFLHISTQMNVPDCKGKESLFQAEMNRCKDKLDVARTCKGFVAFALDEIFSSTEPIEGIAAAYAVAQRIGSYSNVMAVVSTHYQYLTGLAASDDFENYRMTCTDALEFPYTLEKGISNKQVALDLMKQRGFEPQLVQSALKARDHVCLFSAKENVGML